MQNNKPNFAIFNQNFEVLVRRRYDGCNCFKHRDSIIQHSACEPYLLETYEDAEKYKASLKYIDLETLQIGLYKRS